MSQMSNQSVAKDVGLWALEAVQAARQCLTQAKSTNSLATFHEASAQFAAVLEELPELWPELSEELMQAIWFGSDETVRTHLSEAAAGSLLCAGQAAWPRNLSELFCLIGRAFAEEGRYCTASRLLQRALKMAQSHADESCEKLVLASFADLRFRALPSWHFQMLNDQPRNHAFAAAIQDAVKELSARCGVEPVTCLDIGTGTGLLALVCQTVCQQLGSELPLQTVQVHACEENELLFAIALDVISGAPRSGQLLSYDCERNKVHLATYGCMWRRSSC